MSGVLRTFSVLGMIAGGLVGFLGCNMSLSGSGPGTLVASVFVFGGSAIMGIVSLVLDRLERIERAIRDTKRDTTGSYTKGGL